jgi:serine/threonine protein kinase/roadblock/LC7 domain-containing protein
MSLAAGTRLGPYEILSPIGAGGMGEVYRARDTKLDREVAIKVLPDGLAQDPERLARFEREARVLASLNHPNIAQIYGVSESGDVRALVMELVEGETLRGPLPVELALQYGRQIAEALEAAHEKGIIHRDLKPANIMITPTGIVKVLDFGLAKAADSSTASGDPATSPTLTISATRAGMILGTAAYMSPEQARGKTVDRRADIWAFGVVLYEMLTGKQTFTGETITDVLASVVKEQPSLDQLPVRVRMIVSRCLQKDPRQRWQAIGDVRLEIEALLANPEAIGDERIGSRPLWKRSIPAVGAAIVASAVTAVALWNFKSSAPPPVSRFTVALGEGQHFTNSGRRVVAISPDGTQMVYVANQRLYLRPMAQLEAKAIPGSEDPRGVANPVFSPDGRSIAFFDSGEQVLKRIGTTGGAAVTICQAGNPWGMSWDDSGIVFGEGHQGILRVSPNGGKPELVAAVKADEVATHPQMLPGAQAVMFTLATNGNDWDKGQIVVQELKSGTRKTLIQGGSNARYLLTGHLVYFLGGTLLAVPFDSRRLEVTGGAVPILEEVMRNAVIGVAQIDFANAGSMIYVTGPALLTSLQNSLAFVDGQGNAEPLKPPPAAYYYPRVSPDGKRLVYEMDESKDAAVWIYELSGANAPRRLTFQGVNRYPVWSADGERVAFQSDREGDRGIFWQRADGMGTAERLTKPEAGIAHSPDSFSPDGQQLSFSAYRGSGTSAVWTLSLRDRKATLFAESLSGFAEASMFSPDGRWVAYSVDAETGAGNTVYVQGFPVTAGKYQIATGNDPLWSRDGKELFFLTGPATTAAVNVTTAGGFSFTSPTSVPRGALLGAASGPRRFDVLADGRFIGVVPAALGQIVAPTTPQIQVVLNWFEDLRQRVPTQ